MRNAASCIGVHSDSLAVTLACVLALVHQLSFNSILVLQHVGSVMYIECLLQTVVASVVVHKKELRLRMRGFPQALRYRTRLPPVCAPIGTSNAARTLLLYCQLL
jgi:hypothetical protein